MNYGSSILYTLRNKSTNNVIHIESFHNSIYRTLVDTLAFIIILAFDKKW